MTRNMADGSNGSTIATADAHVSALNSKGRVLLIGDDPKEAERFSWASCALHVDSVWIRRGVAGLEAARRVRFDLVLVNMTLPDMSGIDIVRALRAEGARTRCIVLSDFVTLSVAIDAMDCGAFGVLEKPFTALDMIAVVNTALGTSAAGRMSDETSAPANVEIRAGQMSRDTPRSTAERWASVVLRMIDAAGDPKTITSWASALGVSRSVLCECCRLIHVPAHDTRDFARMIRVICRSGELWEPEAFMDLADARSLKRLLARAGLTNGRALTPTMPEFLDRQQWIPKGNPGLTALRTMLFGAERHPATPGV